MQWKNVINISKRKQRWSQPLLLSFALIRKSLFEHSNAVLFDTKRANGERYLKYIKLNVVC